MYTENGEKDPLYRRVYSVLWGATYDYGWDRGNGSHGGVDIATAAGTPVRSIGDGTVVTAGFLTGWGNVVTVKHTLADNTVIYSDYAHLSKILVAKGEAVMAGKVIGEVGNTGNSYGNHLHFQIDVTNAPHPYYYSSCAKGIGELEVVNRGLCRDDLTANTIDPIAFLESGRVSSPAGPTKAAVDAIQTRPQEKVSRVGMKSRAEIQQEEMDEFMKDHSMTVGLSEIGTNLLVGQTANGQISSTDYTHSATAGNLPEMGLEIDYDHAGISVFPEKIVALDGGGRDFSVTAKKPGSYDISFKMGKTVVATRKVLVFGTKETAKAAGGEIRAPNEILLGDDSNVFVVMKTKYGTPQLDMPYDGNFEVSATNGKVKFCNASKPSSVACRPENLVDRLPFSFADTYRGVLVVRVRAFSFAPVTLALLKTDAGKPATMTKTKKDIVVQNPK